MGKRGNRAALWEDRQLLPLGIPKAGSSEDLTIGWCPTEGSSQDRKGQSSQGWEKICRLERESARGSRAGSTQGRRTVRLRKSVCAGANSWSFRASSRAACFWGPRAHTRESSCPSHPKSLTVTRLEGGTKQIPAWGAGMTHTRHPGVKHFPWSPRGRAA